MQYHAPQHSTHVGCMHNTTTGIAYIPSIVPAAIGGTTWATWSEIFLITLLGLYNYCNLFEIRLDLIIGFRSWFYVFIACALG